jgi:hypothetical protein
MVVKGGDKMSVLVIKEGVVISVCLPLIMSAVWVVYIYESPLMMFLPQKALLCDNAWHHDRSGTHHCNTSRLSVHHALSQGSHWQLLSSNAAAVSVHMQQQQKRLHPHVFKQTTAHCIAVCSDTTCHRPAEIKQHSGLYTFTPQQTVLLF